MRRRLKGERGVAMVEFALVLPLLMLVLVGIFEFGRVFNYWISTNHIANQGARFAVVDVNPSTTTGESLQTYLKNSALTAELRNGLSVCIDYPNDPGSTHSSVGDPVRVRVRKAFNFVPFINLSPIIFQGEAVMRIERLEGALHTTPSKYSTSANIAGDAGCP